MYLHSKMSTDIRGVYLTGVASLVLYATVVGSYWAGKDRLGVEDTAKLVFECSFQALKGYHGGLLALLGAPFYAVGRRFSS